MGLIHLLNQELIAFSVKNQVVNILDFIGHTVSFAPAQLYHCSTKQGNMETKSCVTLKLYLKKTIRKARVF